MDVKELADICWTRASTLAKAQTREAAKWARAALSGYEILSQSGDSLISESASESLQALRTWKLLEKWLNLANARQPAPDNQMRWRAACACGPRRKSGDVVYASKQTLEPSASKNPTLNRQRSCHCISDSSGHLRFRRMNQKLVRVRSLEDRSAVPKMLHDRC